MDAGVFRNRSVKKTSLRGIVANRLGVDPSDKKLESKVNAFYQFYMEDNEWEEKYIPFESMEFREIPESVEDDTEFEASFEVDMDTIRKERRKQSAIAAAANATKEEDKPSRERSGGSSRYAKRNSRQSDDSAGMENLRRLAIAGHKR